MSGRRRSPTALIVQAHLGSTRLPRKVLLPLGGKTLIEQVLARAQAVVGVDKVVVAIPDEPEEEELVELVTSSGLADIARGPDEDVLARTWQAAMSVDAEVVVRITSDCPMF